MTPRIKGGGNLSIGGGQERQRFLHGARTRRFQVLVRATGVAEPCAVGDIDQRVRAILLVDHLAGKDRLVADQRTDERQGTCKVRGPGPRANPPTGTIWISGNQLGWYSPTGRTAPLLAAALWPLRRQTRRWCDVSAV